MRTTISGYRLHRLIDRRGGGELWLGLTPDRSRPVAIKRRAVDDERNSRRSSIGEAAALAAADHPNVVALIEVLDDPPDEVLVQPWVPGGSLRQLLDERGTLLPGEVVALLQGLADAVEHLAARGMVHGALRPDHIVLTADGAPVLVGFGAVTALVPVADVALGQRASAGPASLDVSGPPGGDAGDVAYLHPSVALGGRPTGRTEVFAVAVMAYECLTGRVPHRGTAAEVVALAAAGVHRPLSSWPSVPSGVAEAVEAALTCDGLDLAMDAGSFLARLRTAVDPATVVRPRPRADRAWTIAGPAADETLPFGSRPSVAVGSERADAWRVAVAAVIAVAVVAGLWFLAGAVLSI